ncbi:MAG: type II secretion system F family protein [Rhodospirillales bacterium]|nr:MAG: type II secretion system F family protein [Rhodospirillales bacterium]
MIELLPGLPPLVNALLVAMLVGVLVGTITTLAVQHAEKVKLNRRIALVAGTLSTSKSGGGARAAGQRKRMVAAKLKEIEDKAKAKKSSSNSLRDMMLQANLDWTPKRYYIVSAVVAVVGTALYLLKGFPPMVTPLVTITLGLGLPRWVLRKMALRRQKAFTFKFADAVDVIVRGIRSGLPVGECLNIIGREMPEPIGLEFRLIVEGQKLGLTMSEVLDRSLARMPTAELKFFAIVLAIQQQTGGNLADTLSKLSDVLRGRKKLQDKIKSLSSEAKASASIIGSLPFFVSGLLYLINPGYMGILFSDPTGHVLIAGGLAWMGMGVFVMSRMISFDY